MLYIGPKKCAKVCKFFYDAAIWDCVAFVVFYNLMHIKFLSSINYVVIQI